MCVLDVACDAFLLTYLLACLAFHDQGHISLLECRVCENESIIVVRHSHSESGIDLEKCFEPWMVKGEEIGGLWRRLARATSDWLFA